MPGAEAGRPSPKGRDRQRRRPRHLRLPDASTGCRNRTSGGPRRGCRDGSHGNRSRAPLPTPAKGAAPGRHQSAVARRARSDGASMGSCERRWRRAGASDRGGHGALVLPGQPLYNLPRCPAPVPGIEAERGPGGAAKAPGMVGRSPGQTAPADPVAGLRRNGFPAPPVETKPGGNGLSKPRRSQWDVQAPGPAVPVDDTPRTSVENPPHAPPAAGPHPARPYGSGRPMPIPGHRCPPEAPVPPREPPTSRGKPKVSHVIRS